MQVDDSDIPWPISSTESLSTNGTANTMDFDFQSDETDPKIIIAATVHVEQEEVEPQVQAEVNEAINDVESMVGDTPTVVDMGDDETGLQEEFVFGGILWNANWIEDMNLYDDLDKWYYDGDELPGINSGESWDHNEDSNSSSKKTTGDSSSRDPSEDSPVS